MTALALSLRDVRIAFAGLARPALAIPAFDLPAGTSMAVTGASGSGKTTLLNLLSGLVRADAGVVAWADTDLSTLGEPARDRWRARHIGLVMQDFHLLPGLSALDNVLLPQRLAAWRLPQGLAAYALDLLARVGIDAPRQAVDTLSRGQMQRVAVARALVARPGIVVADEPTASLDADAGDAVAMLLTKLTAESGATLVVASHDPAVVGRLDRTIRLDGGRLADG